MTTNEDYEITTNGICECFAMKVVADLDEVIPESVREEYYPDKEIGTVVGEVCFNRTDLCGPVFSYDESGKRYVSGITDQKVKLIRMGTREAGIGTCVDTLEVGKWRDHYDDGEDPLSFEEYSQLCNLQPQGEV